MTPIFGPMDTPRSGDHFWDFLDFWKNFAKKMSVPIWNFDPLWGAWNPYRPPGGAKGQKKMKFLDNFRVLVLQIIFYTQNTSPDKNTKKIFFRKFFLRFFFGFFRKILKNRKNEPPPFRENTPFQIGSDIIFAQNFQRIQKISKVVSWPRSIHKNNYWGHRRS